MTATNVSTIEIASQVPSFEMTADNLHALLKAAALWASDDVTRRSMAGVRIEIEGRGYNRVRFVSTNGHALYIGSCVAVTMREGYVNLTKECVAALLSVTKPATRKKAAPVEVVFSGIDRCVKVGNVSVILSAVDDDCPFPTYHQAIPKTPPVGLKDGFIGVSLAYLGMVAKTFPARDSVCVETHGNELSPLEFRGETVPGEDASLLLMPTRI